MRRPPKTPRTPAPGHATRRTGARRSPKPSAQCENRPSHQTQYPRFHEITHGLGVGYGEYGRAQAEVLVDTVTYVVLAGQVGLDVSGESIPYVAGWGEQGALDAIREFAGTIDQIARRIENAITPTRMPVPADHPSELERVA
jgi:hypothetical protein